MSLAVKLFFLHAGQLSTDSRALLRWLSHARMLRHFCSLHIHRLSCRFARSILQVFRAEREKWSVDVWLQNQMALIQRSSWPHKHLAQLLCEPTSFVIHLRRPHDFLGQKHLQTLLLCLSFRCSSDTFLATSKVHIWHSILGRWWYLKSHICALGNFFHPYWTLHRWQVYFSTSSGLCPIARHALHTNFVCCFPWWWSRSDFDQ